MASYNLNDNSVRVYSKNRALADVLRSIAHELVHHKQLEDGRIDVNNPPQDVGGEIEDLDDGTFYFIVNTLNQLNGFIVFKTLWDFKFVLIFFWKYLNLVGCFLIVFLVIVFKSELFKWIMFFSL